MATADDGVEAKASTTVDSYVKWEGEANEDSLRTMGRKTLIPYGLYAAKGFVSAPLAESTGFSEDDLGLLWEALNNMFDHDRSASKGIMSCRRLIVFKHVGATPEMSKLGMAPSHRLLDLDTDFCSNDKAVVSIRLREGIKEPRCFEQYKVEIREDRLSNGIEVIEP